MQKSNVASKNFPITNETSQADNFGEARFKVVTMKNPEMIRRDLRPLTSIHIAPYMQVATALIGKGRECGGNMFRHQVDTMSILIDYGYVDSVLLKASLIHDVIEDIPDFNINEILTIDSEAGQVYDLVLEVPKKRGRSKAITSKALLSEARKKQKF